MTTSTTSPLEKLPLLILERICEYLDDGLERRRSLWAFALTSSCCCAAAVIQLYSQIQLKIHAQEEAESIVKRWTEVLTPDGRHRHVRRLKVSCVATEEADDEKDNEANSYWYVDMHNFCRPSNSYLDCSRGGGITDHPEAWVSLSRFISQLSGLQDLVWAYGSHIPKSFLSVVSARGCRLHMHCFRLSSLVQQRDNPQPIDPDDYALVTSPCLYSIVARLVDFETDGMLNYTKEAVMKMVAGTAPNLALVYLTQTRAGDSLANREAIRLGKPAWSGFLSPGTLEPDQVQGLGSLQALVFSGYPYRDIDRWARYTGFAKLRCLAMPWSLENGVAMAEMAMSGTFESLKTLCLLGIEDETDQAQEALIRLLESLHPLGCLEMSGYISNEAFDIILCRHGGTLRNLSIDPYREDESQNPLVVFSEATVRRLAERCPSLEKVTLVINRTRGDNQETGIYRALSRLPQLRFATLKLCYSVGPDEEFWDDERDGEYPFSLFVEPEEIPSAFLREAFSNSAIDATLALSIFNLISSGGSLRYLILQPRRKMTTNAPGFGSGQFGNVLRWFSRSWVCKRDFRGEVAVRELDKKETASAGEEWKYLSENTHFNGEEIYQEVFNEIWPQKTPEWWKDWKSLPLSKGPA